MKVAAFVLLLAVAGLLVVGAVDAKKMDKREKPQLAIAVAGADACASGEHIAATATSTATYTESGRCGVAAGSSSESFSASS
jgi:hypothetical protein